MHAWLCETLDGVEALQWRELPTPEPKPGEVRIAIKAASLNFPDLLIVHGKYQFKPPLPFVPGSEFAGVVDAVGEGVQHLKLGMPVAAIAGTGGFGTHACVDAARVLPLPPGFALEDGAAFAFTYGTSHHALIDRAAAQGRRDGAGARCRRWRRHGRVADRQGRRRQGHRRRIERREVRAVQGAGRRRDAQLQPPGRARDDQGAHRRQGPRRGLRPGGWRTGRAGVSLDRLARALPGGGFCRWCHPCPALEPGAAQGRLGGGRVLG